MVGIMNRTILSLFKLYQDSEGRLLAGSLLIRNSLTQVTLQRRQVDYKFAAGFCMFKQIFIKSDIHIF